MRLLNVKDLRFADFQDSTKRPKYAIASHRWAADETTYKDVRDKRNQESAGYQKVEAFASYVREVVGYIEWLWIDTCCINKKDAVELSYAINSMFRWYRDAELCIAYLSDIGTTDCQLGESEWFRRGWTLQELLAPQVVIFVTGEWQIIGNVGASFHSYSYDKTATGPDLSAEIASITNLPEHILNDWAKAINISTNERIKWMDGRATTVEEDESYALLGIVGVSMSMIYGEGRDMARQRLLGTIRQRDKLATENVERFQQIKDWLSPADPWTNHYSACELHEKDTGLWLLCSEEFQAWKARSNRSTRSTRHLWIHGKAGCGKTILCATIIEHMQAFCQGQVDVGQSIFYFSFTDNKKQSFENLVRSLVGQLGWKGGPGLLMLQQAYHRPDRKALGLDEMLKILYSCLSSYTDVYLHIDALDECSEDGGVRRNLLERLSVLLQQASNLHVVVTSRDIPDIRRFMERLDAVPVSIAAGTVQPDISLYISRQIALSEKLSHLDVATKAMIEETLTRKADGMFRWVYCQLQQLNKSKSTKPRAIRKALDDLPASLDETYERMLSAVDEDDYADAYTLLRWLAYAHSPLSLLELAETCIIDPTNKPSSAGIVDVSNRGGWGDTLNLLAGLVVTAQTSVFFDASDYSDAGDYINPQEGPYGDIRQKQIGPDTTIRLAHFSVQEYLESSRILDGNAKQFHLNPAREHMFITQNCLVYLTHYSNSALKTLSEQDLTMFPLLSYSAQWWWRHAQLQQADDVSREIAFLTDEETFRDLLQVHTPEEWWPKPFYTNQSYIGTALCYASYTGLEKVVAGLLDAGADVNGHGGDYGNALLVASTTGYTDIVHILLNAGAAINARADVYDFADLFHRESLNLNALESASCSGQKKVVQMLLDAGADANAQGGEYAFQEASSKGHAEVVQMLLVARAHINTQKEAKDEALYAACHQGHAETVRILLDAGADINVRGESHDNALQAASRGGYERVVQMLLDAGANANAQGAACDDALRAASSGGHVDVVQMLLDAGANVNGGQYTLPSASYRRHGKTVQKLAISRRGRYFPLEKPNTALEAASSEGRKKVVQMLLDAGADAYGGQGALLAASFRGHVEVVQMLLDAGADINAQGGYYGNALQAVVVDSDNVKSVRLLLDRSADVNAQGGYYGNALQAAAAHSGHVEIVRLLLDRGADVNAQGGYYGNALQAAAANSGHVASMRLLLDRGADVNAQGGYYGNALQAAAVYSGHVESARLLLDRGADVNAQGGYYGNALQAAAHEGNIEIVRLLLNRGADVNAQGGDYGNALQAAAHEGNIESMRLLLDRGADVNAQGGLFGMALFAAYLREHANITQLLMERGADLTRTDALGCTFFHLAASVGALNAFNGTLASELDINALDKRRWSPLHWAAYCGRSETIELLLRKGARSSIQDWRGQTPYQVAIWSSQDRTVLAQFPEFDGNTASPQHTDLFFQASCNCCGKCGISFYSPWHNLCEQCAQREFALHLDNDFEESFTAWP